MTLCLEQGLAVEVSPHLLLGVDGVLCYVEYSSSFGSPRRADVESLLCHFDEKERGNLRVVCHSHCVTRTAVCPLRWVLGERTGEEGKQSDTGACVSARGAGGRQSAGALSAGVCGCQRSGDGATWERLLTFSGKRPTARKWGRKSFRAFHEDGFSLPWHVVAWHALPTGSDGMNSPSSSGDSETVWFHTLVTF